MPNLIDGFHDYPKASKWPVAHRDRKLLVIVTAQSLFTRMYTLGFFKAKLSKIQFNIILQPTHISPNVLLIPKLRRERVWYVDISRSVLYSLPISSRITLTLMIANEQ